MKLKTLLCLSAAVALYSAPVSAKKLIVALAPDAATQGPALLRHLAETVAALGPSDELLVYSSQPFTLVGSIKRPSDPNMNNARIRAALAQQFKPVRDYLSVQPPPRPGEPAGNLMIPATMDSLSRNVLSSLAEQKVDVLLVGSLLYWDHRDETTSMSGRRVPSDGTLWASRESWPYSIVGMQNRLTGVNVHFCTPGAEYESAEFEERLRRFWSLWTVGQGGRVATMSGDFATCFRRFDAGEASGQTAYQLSTDTRAEMLRVASRSPAILPESYDAPGEYFLRNDAPISRNPPSVSAGIAWVGIKWTSPCDLDLYARGDASSPWLYFGNSRSSEGQFNKDFTNATGDSQFEFIAFTRAVELAKAEVAVNLYTCNVSTPPEAIVRVWFSAKIYETQIRLGAKNGNKGAMPIAGPYWVKVDLRKVVGLAAP